MVEEIDFENRHFWNFKSHVTLTLTSDDLESDIVVNDSSTLTNTTIWFVAALSLIVDVRTDIHMYVWTFLPGLLGHLWGGDLIKCRDDQQINHSQTTNTQKVNRPVVHECQGCGRCVSAAAANQELCFDCEPTAYSCALPPRAHASVAPRTTTVNTSLSVLLLTGSKAAESHRYIS